MLHLATKCANCLRRKLYAAALCVQVYEDRVSSPGKLVKAVSAKLANVISGRSDNTGALAQTVSGPPNGNGAHATHVGDSPMGHQALPTMPQDVHVRVNGASSPPSAGILTTHGADALATHDSGPAHTRLSKSLINRLAGSKVVSHAPERSHRSVTHLASVFAGDMLPRWVQPVEGCSWGRLGSMPAEGKRGHC